MDTVVLASRFAGGLQLFGTDRSDSEVESVLCKEEISQHYSKEELQVGSGHHMLDPRPTNKGGEAGLHRLQVRTSKQCGAGYLYRIHQLLAVIVSRHDPVTVQFMRGGK